MSSSPFIKKSFEDAGCLRFCLRVEELKFHDKLTSSFSTELKREKVTIVGFQFTISRKLISASIGILDTGEIWFQKEDIDLKNYKMYLKAQHKETPTFIFPFRHLLER